MAALATSYIPTTTAQVTRAADVATITGSNFSGFYNQNEGTWYADWIAGQDDIFINTFSTGSSSANFGFMNLRRGSSGNFAFNVVDGTTTQASITLITGSPITGTNYKSSAAFKINDFAATNNVATPGTDTAGTVPSTIANLVLGNGWNNSTGAPAVEYLNGTIRKIGYYPTRLSNAQLQNITS